LAKSVPFVDREKELRVLEDLALRGSETVLYIYGPEGCGKTRLLREFARRFNGVAIYIDALSYDPAKAIEVSPVVRGVAEAVAGVLSGYSGPAGAYLATRIGSLVEKLLTRLRLSGEHVVIAVDDVAQVIGPSRVEWYVKWLYELSHRLLEDYGAESVLAVATTSEGVSRRLVLRHRHGTVRLLWSLPRSGFEEMLRILGRVDIAEELWGLIGGNPGRLLEIATTHRWNTEEWLEELEERLVEPVSRARREGLVDQLIEAINDPDYLLEADNKLLGLLEENNLVAYTGHSLLTGERLEPDPGLGVGRYYAWQLPAYRKALLRLLERA